MRPYITAGDYIEICRDEAPMPEIEAAQQRARAVTGLVPEVKYTASKSDFAEVLARLGGQTLREARLEVGSPVIAELVWRHFPGDLGRVDIEPRREDAACFQIMAQPVQYDGRTCAVQLLASGAVVVTEAETGTRHLGHWDGVKIAGCDLPIEVSYQIALWLVCRVRTRACACVLDPEDPQIADLGPFPPGTVYVGLLAGAAPSLETIPVTPIAYVGWGDGAQVRLPALVLSAGWLVEHGADETELHLAIGCRRATVIDPMTATTRRPCCESCLGIVALRWRLERYEGPVAACYRCVRMRNGGTGPGQIRA